MKENKDLTLNSALIEHSKKYWWFYVVFALVLPILVIFRPDMTLANLGTYGDFIGGFIGTIISLITLIAIFKSFKQANDQSLQNTIALLLQSYHHTVEDYDYNGKQGREAIKECINSFKTEKNSNYLKEIFPTHIPAIIVSILYTIDDSGHDKKNALYKQIKTMLSFEERQLLLLYLLELQGSNNSKDAEDYEKDKNLLLKSIFENGVGSKSLEGFQETYNKIYGIN
jgi:hypothetical protein